MSKIINGKCFAQELRDNLKKEILELKEKYKKDPE